HALADPLPAHALAHPVDLAGAVAVRDDEGVAGPVAGAAPAVAVGWVDPREADAHAHLAGARLGIGQLADFEHRARRTVLAVICRPHLVVLAGWVKRSAGPTQAANQIIPRHSPGRPNLP